MVAKSAYFWGISTNSNPNNAINGPKITKKIDMYTIFLTGNDSTIYKNIIQINY